MRSRRARGAALTQPSARVSRGPHIRKQRGNEMGTGVNADSILYKEGFFTPVNPRYIRHPAVESLIAGTELLLKVKAKILAEPEEFDMGYFCGTQCCIAGHALILAGLPCRDVEREAARVLELRKPKAGRLFHIEQWPFKFRLGYAGAHTHPSRSEIAADRIDRFIATGGRE